MLKLALIAGLAGATLGVAVLGAGPASAQAVCLNPYAGAISLSHNDMVPNEGFGYDKDALNAELAKGNRCPEVTTQQSSPYPLIDQQMPRSRQSPTRNSSY